MALVNRVGKASRACAGGDCADGAYTDRACTDGAYADGACADRAYTDGACADGAAY